MLKWLRFQSLALINSSSFRSQHTAAKISALASKNPGDQIKIQGWVQNVRKMKRNTFVDIADGSSCNSIQVVLSKDNCANSLRSGDSVEVKGCLGLTPRNQLEIRADDVKVIGECKVMDGYPFTPKQVHPTEYVREYMHLRSKVSYMRSLFRVRHKATKFFHDFMDENGFVHINTPILTTNDCEGAGEVFTVKPDSRELLQQMAKGDAPAEDIFFDHKVFLSVSGQLCLEAISHGLGNVYSLSPAFRAENCRSTLHLAEFYMLEAELAFVWDLKDVTSFVEKMIKTTTERLAGSCEEDLMNCSTENERKALNFPWLHREWPVLSYDEAFSILLKHKNKLSTELTANSGFSKEQELFLVEYSGAPVFVVDWPKSIKPFYMKVIPSDPTKVLAVDLLMPRVGELMGGSLREDDYDRLKCSIPEGLEWYLELRKFGSVPTGGFGLGLERYLQLITEFKNIRDVIPFPRYPHSCVM